MRTFKLTFLILGVILVFLGGCVTTPRLQPLPPQEINLNIKAVDAVKVEEEGDIIHRSMEIANANLELSRCKMHKDSAYVTIESMIWADEYWKDFKLLRSMGIKNVYIYLNSPGGSTSQGFAITDELRLLRESGVEIIIQARGTIASAAIPIFLAGTTRICTKNTIFLIHPSAIVKYGLFFETLKDIESQAEMMKLNRNMYADLVASRSNLEKEKVLELLGKDTWFGAEQAKDWGLVDRIE